MCLCRTVKKYTHLVFEVAAIILMISALFIMVATKLDGGFKQFYSVHAWTGILVIVLSVAQVRTPTLSHQGEGGGVQFVIAANMFRKHRMQLYNCMRLPLLSEHLLSYI
jgi:hypothetical protein